MSIIQQIQNILKVAPDNVWGPKSQQALIEAAGNPDLIKPIQKLLRVKQDGIWGVKSQGALNEAAHGEGNEDGWMSCEASSFADPADVRAFKKCKATGKSDIQCFAVGDNGIGQFGKITAQEEVPMIAVHKTEMVRRWGSIAAAAHRRVIVEVKGVEIEATVEDRISALGRIDLNPACAKQLLLKPPFVVPCRWRWA